MRKTRSLALLAVGLIAAVALTFGVLAALPGGDGKTLGKQAPAAQRVSIDKIDHSAWSELLSTYVDDKGLVDYKAWKASQDAQRKLDDYLAELSRADRNADAKRDARLAFWINAYNAVTVKGILREYPTSSIRNHTGVVGYNIWKDLPLQVGAKAYSLHAMEHEILREMGEPRIHFAINCASLGCPPLRQEAFVAERLEEQLADIARRFFADPGKFRYDSKEGTIRLSPILKWFAEDFGASQQERLATIAPYLPDEEARQLARSGDVEVSYLDYDWSLNGQNPLPE